MPFVGVPSWMRGLTPVLLLVTTLLPIVPVAAAEDECVNVAVDQSASGTGPVLSVFGVVAVGVAVGPSAVFRDGASVVVWVVPSACGVSAPCERLSGKLQAPCHVDVNRPALP